MTNENRQPESTENQSQEAFAEQLGQAASEMSAESQNRSLEEQVQDAEKQHLLAVAELENFRKRSRQATQEQIKYASLPLMSETLEALDNLQRAVDAASDDASSSGLLEGVNMVASQLLSILASHGCKKIESLGKPFDPNLHQAVQMQPSREFPADTVMMELRAGYQLHDRVIRPSQVFVSTGPEAGE